MGILALVFAVNVLIRFPFQKAVDITQHGVSCLAVPGKQWFSLGDGCYTVVEEFETIAMRNSIIPFFAKRYTYFNVEVRSGEDSFVMPIRVTAKKAKELRQGESVSLYGMVSNTKFSEEQIQDLNNQISPVSRMCLNDNGDTVITRALSACVFLALTIACVWLAAKIYLVGRQ